MARKAFTSVFPYPIIKAYLALGRGGRCVCPPGRSEQDVSQLLEQMYKL